MIEIYEKGLFDKYRTGSYLFALMLGCLNPNTNRLEINGRPMNSVDLCAYANLTMQELSMAVKELLSINAIMIVRGKGKEFYFANPEYIREGNKTPDDFDWLLQLFEEENNQEDKNLVYFKKSNRNLTVKIGEAITDLNNRSSNE
jgi:DNA-binding transcriptional regulator GbsR (MarR family)